MRDGQAHSISSLCTNTQLTRQPVTERPHVLERAGLVAGRGTGRERRFAVRPETLAYALAYLDRISARWVETLVPLQGLGSGLN